MSNLTCNATIDLQAPISSERVRGFQPPWRTVFVYRCLACSRTVRVRANAYYGLRRTKSGRVVPGTPVPGIGGIQCGGSHE